MKQELDNFLLRLIKRIKAFRSRVSALEELTGDYTEYFDVEYSDLVYDLLGIPAFDMDNWAEKHVRNSRRELLDDKLQAAHTNSEILGFISRCRQEASDAQRSGSSRPDGWSPFDNFDWGSPPPSENDCRRAENAGAELAHGMTRAEVRKATEDAKVAR